MWRKPAEWEWREERERLNDQDSDQSGAGEAHLCSRTLGVRWGALDGSGADRHYSVRYHFKIWTLLGPTRRSQATY